jgi:hypothetical protein
MPSSSESRLATPFLQSGGVALRVKVAAGTTSASFGVTAATRADTAGPCARETSGVPQPLYPCGFPMAKCAPGCVGVRYFTFFDATPTPSLLSRGHQFLEVFRPCSPMKKTKSSPTKTTWTRAGAWRCGLPSPGCTPDARALNNESCRRRHAPGPRAPRARSAHRSGRSRPRRGTSRAQRFRSFWCFQP